MNLTNPHQTIRKEDRRDVQALSKTDRAARLINHGVNHAVVRKIVNSTSTMPKLNQGVHPAAEIVARYRQVAVTRLNNMEFIMLKARRGSFAGCSDDDLRGIALRLESMAVDIQKYLITKTAGGCND